MGTPLLYHPHCAQCAASTPGIATLLCAPLDRHARHLLMHAAHAICRETAQEVSFDDALWTPLGLASRLGHLDIVRLLLVKGADVGSACSGYMGRDQARKDACGFGSRCVQGVHVGVLTSWVCH